MHCGGWRNGMTKHFAASWLQSLSAKLEALSEWSWASDRRGECTTHRNLFREFFSAQFGKTLALVDEAKKTEFLGVIERSLYKFDANTQQFPLMCLCALLQHGKDSPKTQEKILAWVGFLLERLRRTGGVVLATQTSLVAEVVEECLSAPFQKFVPLMEDAVRGRLADGLGERLGELGEEAQRRVLEELPAVSARIEEVVVGCTGELNAWLERAPRFPATPMALADTLAKMEHPLVRFFTAVKQPARKEAFLVAVALALQGLRTRFRWMCAAEPDLESLGGELQRKLFTVEGQGPVMEMWLSSRLKKYNAEVATRTAALVTGDPTRSEALRSRLVALFPDRGNPSQAASAEGGWLALDGPTSLADALLAWLSESSPSFFCPQHTLARETLTGVLLRFSSYFEVDGARMRARLRAPGGEAAPPPPPVPPPSALALAHAAAQAAQGTSRQPPPPPGAPPLRPLGSAVVVPPPVPVVVPPPAGLLGTAPAATASSALALALQQLKVPPGAGPGGPEVDNLVDLLLNEALEGVAPEIRAQITKAGHGVYRMGTKEVTLHTTNGRLYVYRIGEVIRHVPIQTLLREEGLLPAQLALPAPGGAAVPLIAALGATPPGAGAPVDVSAVSRIMLQSKQISAGVTITTSGVGQQPFTISRADPQALMSKRVEAATKAMDVSKQIVRRSINFDDEKLLRRLLVKGLKHDKKWQEVYQEYCTGRGIVDMDQKNQNKDFVANFIERNLANFINEDWAKKIIYPSTEADGEKKDRKDKKDKKDKRKKDKKRKASDSSSSTMLALPAPPVAAGSGARMSPMHHGMPRPPGPPGMDPMTMSMFGGWMMNPMHMFADSSMAGMSFGMLPGIPDERAMRKKARKEEKEKGEKPKKEKGSKVKK